MQTTNGISKGTVEVILPPHTKDVDNTYQEQQDTTNNGGAADSDVDDDNEKEEEEAKDKIYILFI